MSPENQWLVQTYLLLKEFLPFKIRDEFVGFRGSVPFGTPPSLKPRFLVGQRKLEKVGENRDQEKSIIFMGPILTLTPLFQGGSAQRN